jgi:hypothetical protein
MDTTTRYSLPYQESTDAPNGPTLGKELAEAVEAAVGDLDDRVTAVEDEAGRLGIIKYGNRGSQKTITSSETGIVRLDGIAVKAGRAYSIRAPQLRVDSVTATDKFAFQIRINTAGAATTASTSVAQCETQDQQTGSAEHIYMPGSDLTLSVLLCARIYSGSSASNVMNDSSNLVLLVEDLGPAVPDTGVDV